MSAESNVLNFYVVCNKLKDTVRTGWKSWRVNRERIESVAEHIYSVQMLAIAMKSEYQYNIDIMRVIYMIAIHELGEALIGDLTQFQIERNDKEEIEHTAVHAILGNLVDGEFIEALFLEFDAHETPEAMFAYQCDKLECDLQCKMYDEESCVDLSLHQADSDDVADKTVRDLLSHGKTWSEMWLELGQQRYPYDDNFRAVSNYALKHRLHDTTS